MKWGKGGVLQGDLWVEIKFKIAFFRTGEGEVRIKISKCNVIFHFYADVVLEKVAFSDLFVCVQLTLGCAGRALAR